MPNCPCENVEETCVDADAPVTRVLDGGGCVHLGLAIVDTPTVNLDVNGSGQLKADAVVSGDSGQSLEARASGLYVPSPTQTTAASLLCDADDCGDITPTPSNLPNACNGLEVRTCPGTCGGENQSGIWAPPELRSRTFGGTNSANDAFFAPFTGDGGNPQGRIPAGQGANSGSPELEGYVFRAIPYLTGGVRTANLKYQVDNPWCTEAILDIGVAASAGKYLFTPGDTWVIDTYNRIYYETSGGATTIVHGGLFRATAAQQVDTTQGVSVSLGARRLVQKINAGDFGRFRTEVVIFIRTSGSNPVIFSGFSGLKMELNTNATLQASHRNTAFNINSV